MFPNLLEATREYWRKLDELETAYKQGRISIEEVDASVNVLMEELGRERRKALFSLWQNWKQWLALNREVLVGLLVLMSIAYIWTSTIQIS